MIIEPSTLIAYRAGELDSPRGIFFADSFDAAWLYAHANGLPVVAFEVTVNKVLEISNQYSWVSKRTGQTVEQIKAQKAQSKDPSWLRKLDTKIMNSAINEGYDCIRYTDPTTPNAKWEIVVFSTSQCVRLGECDNHGNILSEMKESMKKESIGFAIKKVF